MLQMADGVGDVLVDDLEGCAEAIVGLLTDRRHAEALARESARRDPVCRMAIAPAA